MGKCQLTTSLKYKVETLNRNLKAKGQSLLSLRYESRLILLYEGAFAMHLVEKTKAGKEKLLLFLNQEFKEHLAT